MFSVSEKQWDMMSKADKNYFADWMETEFEKMETHAEDIVLPSGTVFRVFCDGRGFIKESEANNERQV